MQVTKNVTKLSFDTVKIGIRLFNVGTNAGFSCFKQKPRKTRNVPYFTGFHRFWPFHG